MRNKNNLITNILEIILSSMIFGFVLSKTWLWIAVPTFNYPPISLEQAVIILFIINLILKFEIKKKI